MNIRFIPRLIVALLLISLAACKQPITGAPVAYPSGWPEPNLRVPAGSVRAVSSHVLHISNGQDGYILDGGTWDDMKDYAIGFRCDLDWDNLVAHFEQYLLSNGYSPENGSNKTKNSHSRTRSACYWNADHTKGIDIYRDVNGVYALRIIVATP